MRQVFAQLRLHFRHVNPIHDFVFDFFNGLLPGLVVIENFENFEARFRLNNVGDLVFVHFEDDIFELLGKLPALEGAEVAAFVLGAALGISLGNFAELFALHYAVAIIVGLLLDGFDFLGGFSLRVEKNFRQVHLLGANEIFEMRVVVLLHFVVADDDALAHFAMNHFLREQAVANLRFVFFPGEALAFDGFFKLIEARKIVLFANVVEVLDHVGFDADAFVFAALNQELLVDHVAQQIFLFILIHRVKAIGRAALALFGDVGFQRAFGFGVIGERYYVVVYTCDDFFGDESVTGGSCGRRGGRRWRRLDDSSGLFLRRIAKGSASARSANFRYLESSKLLEFMMFLPAKV